MCALDQALQQAKTEVGTVAESHLISGWPTTELGVSHDGLAALEMERGWRWGLLKRTFTLPSKPPQI